MGLTGAIGKHVNGAASGPLRVQALNAFLCYMALRCWMAPTPFTQFWLPRRSICETSATHLIWAEPLIRAYEGRQVFVLELFFTLVVPLREPHPHLRLCRPLTACKTSRSLDRTLSACHVRSSPSGVFESAARLEPVQRHLIGDLVCWALLDSRKPACTDEPVT